MWWLLFDTPLLSFVIHLKANGLIYLAFPVCLVICLPSRLSPQVLKHLKSGLGFRTTFSPVLDISYMVQWIITQKNSTQDYQKLLSHSPKGSQEQTSFRTEILSNKLGGPDVSPPPRSSEALWPCVGPSSICALFRHLQNHLLYRSLQEPAPFPLRIQTSIQVRVPTASYRPASMNSSYRIPCCLSFPGRRLWYLNYCLHWQEAIISAESGRIHRSTNKKKPRLLMNLLSHKSNPFPNYGIYILQGAIVSLPGCTKLFSQCFLVKEEEEKKKDQGEPEKLLEAIWFLFN